MTDPNTIAYPGDLTLLKQLFDRVCVEECIQDGSDRAGELSVFAMALFANGEVEEAVLYEHLRQAARAL